MSVEFGPLHSLPADELTPGSLLDLPLRVWAEVGRARMPASSVVGMSEGTIIDLDREPDEAADLYVNGRHFGTCRLILVEGEWALRIESLDDEGGSEDESEPEAVEHLSILDQDASPASD